MEKIRKISREQRRSILEKYEGSKLLILGWKYIIVKIGNEIIESEDDNIFDSQDIIYAFIFPEIRYTPQSYWYYSYLSPIIINSNYEVTNGIIKFGDWIFNFEGQDLERRAGFMFLRIKNKVLGFEGYYDFGRISNNDLHFTFDKFKKGFELVNNIKYCEELSLAKYLYSTFKEKESLIEKLKKRETEIERLERVIQNI